MKDYVYWNQNPDELYHYGRKGMKWYQHIYTDKAIDEAWKPTRYHKALVREIAKRKYNTPDKRNAYIEKHDKRGAANAFYAHKAIKERDAAGYDSKDTYKKIKEINKKRLSKDAQKYINSDADKVSTLIGAFGAVAGGMGLGLLLPSPVSVAAGTIGGYNAGKISSAKILSYVNNKSLEQKMAKKTLKELETELSVYYKGSMGAARHTRSKSVS